MQGWQAYLKPDEVARLIKINAERRDLLREKIKIYDRARKRMERAL